MAAHGGGSWKVAYADFITAMMAFFLVMWIAAQDQKIKQAVARYFNNPMNLDTLGTSHKPDKTGALFEYPSAGSVPRAESIAMGRGRHSHSPRGASSPITKLIGDWLHADEKLRKYWREQALQNRELASLSWEVREKPNSLDIIAARQLSKQLQDEVTREIPSQVNGLYKDLLFQALSNANWLELAEDLLSE